MRSLLKVRAYHDHMSNYQRELEDEVSRRTEQLRKVYISIRRAFPATIMRLSRVAEYKDEDTGTHIARMSSYAVLVASQLGLGTSPPYRPSSTPGPCTTGGRSVSPATYC